jgi:hypothetical protein
MQVAGWFRGFKDGHINVESGKRTGSLAPNKSDEVITHTHDLVRADRRLITREVAEELKIYSVSCQAMLANYVGMRRVSTKFALWLLRAELKEHRLSVVPNFIECAAEE